MNILSVFDGMSCGQIAANQAGVAIDKYYASEIDVSAINVTLKNFPDTIQVGDITKVNSDLLETIDLLIGGSPCQGFSFAGKQLNFDDPRSQLFFEFVRIWEECKPKYFLLENVRMKKDYQDVISDVLGVEPIEINSGFISAHDRKRLYWTNIEFDRSVLSPNDSCINDIMESCVDKEYYLADKFSQRYYQNSNHVCNPKKSCVIGKLSKYQGDRVFDTKCKASSLSAAGGNNGGGGCNIIWDDARLRRLTPTECELLQNIPMNYTDVAKKSQRYKMLGNGWTVGVIAHILKGIVR